MAIGDVRLTILEIVNEARRKLALKEVSAFTDDTQARVALDFMNDVIAEISDYGDWYSTLKELNVTLISGTSTYNLTTNDVVRRIVELTYNDETSSLRLLDLTAIRHRQRAYNAQGRPRHWGIVGEDSNGNPSIALSPTPGTNENGKILKVLYYAKPPLYSTSNASLIPPYDAKLIVQGLYAELLLDQSDGAQTANYQTEKAKFLQMLSEAQNRYHGDSGDIVIMQPAYYSGTGY